MNKTIALTATLAFVLGVSLGSSQMSQAIELGDFTFGNSVDDDERPHGLAIYFTSGDPINECLWDIVASEVCQRGILFDNQDNMNKKLNWLLEQHGYEFDNSP